MTRETVPWMLSDASGAYLNKISFCAPISRYRQGLLRQNPYLRPDVQPATGLITAKSLSVPRYPGSMGLITAKSLSVPRYPGIDGAYYGKILICAPIFRYRRGLLQQNPYLCPDIPVSTGLITAKSLSVPRCTKVEGIIDLILSHIPASAKAGGYIRPDFISHTRVHEDRWVYST